MPIYDFECAKCGKTKEVVLIIEANKPHCCESPMIQKIGLPALIKIKGQ